MATIISHPSIALGFFPWFKIIRKSKLILFTGMFLTILPDLDVIAFRLGIPYEHMFGHRGFSHSLFFAGTFSVVVSALIFKKTKTGFLTIWIYLFVCMVSHGLIDALTNGGLGIAFFAPFSNERYFFPFHLIEVSPLNIKRFMDGRGLTVLKSELLLVWLPSFSILMTGYIFNNKRKSK
ncbi:MAG: metal-dependent hydrolase [Spirochaetia bacterium]|nr:metal-dependent hydrolase [Spirochaetia bacterium]